VFGDLLRGGKRTLKEAEAKCTGGQAERDIRRFCSRGRVTGTKKIGAVAHADKLALLNARQRVTRSVTGFPADFPDVGRRCELPRFNSAAAVIPEPLFPFTLNIQSEYAGFSARTAASSRQARSWRGNPGVSRQDDHPRGKVTLDWPVVQA
jgi:hypothetical protein